MNRLITILFLGMTVIIMQAKTDKEQLTNEARADGKLACTMPCKEKEDESQIETLYLFLGKRQRRCESRQEEGIKIYKSRWKNDINYCESR